MLPLLWLSCLCGLRVAIQSHMFMFKFPALLFHEFLQQFASTCRRLLSPPRSYSSHLPHNVSKAAVSRGSVACLVDVYSPLVSSSHHAWRLGNVNVYFRSPWAVHMSSYITPGQCKKSIYITSVLFFVGPSGSNCRETEAGWTTSG